MATLSLSDAQVVELVKQLTPESKRRVLADLTAERDRWWISTPRQGEVEMRKLASEHGRDWDRMTEIERESFVDELLHES